MESFALHQIGERPKCSLWAIRHKQPIFTPSPEATPVTASWFHYTSLTLSIRFSINSASLSWFSWWVGSTRSSYSYMTNDKDCPKMRVLSHTHSMQPTHSTCCFQPNNTSTWCHILEQRNQHQLHCEPKLTIIVTPVAILTHNLRFRNPIHLANGAHETSSKHITMSLGEAYYIV